HPPWQKPTEFLSPLQKIFRFAVPRCGAEKWRFGDFFVADRDAEALSELAEFLFVELLLLMRDVAAFTGFAQTVALDCLRQNHRGLSFVFNGGFVSGIDFSRIIAAPQQLVDLLV